MTPRFCTLEIKGKERSDELPSLSEVVKIVATKREINKEKIVSQAKDPVKITDLIEESIRQGRRRQRIMGIIGWLVGTSIGFGLGFLLVYVLHHGLK